MIQAKVDGVPVFDCHYGTSNGQYAIKIDRLLTSSQRGLAGRDAMSTDNAAAQPGADQDKMAAEWAAALAEAKPAAPRWRARRRAVAGAVRQLRAGGGGTAAAPATTST